MFARSTVMYDSNPLRLLMKYKAQLKTAMIRDEAEAMPPLYDMLRAKRWDNHRIESEEPLFYSALNSPTSGWTGNSYIGLPSV